MQNDKDKHLDDEDPWLNFLREETPYIDDAGFSDAVMKELPPPRKLRDRILASSFIAAFLVLALSLGLTQLPILDMIRGASSSPGIFWGFWILIALLIYVVVEERVAEA